MKKVNASFQIENSFRANPKYRMVVSFSNKQKLIETNWLHWFRWERAIKIVLL